MAIAMLVNRIRSGSLSDYVEYRNALYASAHRYIRLFLMTTRSVGGQTRV